MIKKLRYYARFIVVCLLLNKNDTIKKLMEELTGLVDEYTKVFKPTDVGEWNVVLSEISTFLEVCHGYYMRKCVLEILHGINCVG
jgi:hypothetical protein